MPEPKKSDVPEIGLPVFWYPNAIINEQTIPRLGFIQRGWSLNVADLIVLPSQDGACEDRIGVFHKDDPRLRDYSGRISPAGHERGCWEYTPMGKLVLQQEEKEEEETKTSSSTKKTSGKTQTKAS